MCVCTSIRPGSPVYLERSMVSAPAGIAEASVVIARIFTPSMTTIALVHTLPLASHNLPKRTALMLFAPVFSWAKTCVDTSASSTAIAVRDNRMTTVLPHAQESTRAGERSNSVLDGMQTRFGGEVMLARFTAHGSAARNSPRVLPAAPRRSGG